VNEGQELFRRRLREMLEREARARRGEIPRTAQDPNEAAKLADDVIARLSRKRTLAALLQTHTETEIVEAAKRILERRCEARANAFDMRLRALLVRFARWRFASTYAKERPGFPQPEDLAADAIARLRGHGSKSGGWFLDQLEENIFRKGKTTVKNLGLSALKKIQLEERPQESEEDFTARVPAAGTGPLAGLPSGDEDLVRQCTARLPDRERRFLDLCVEHGNASEAQRRLGWPLGSASNAGHVRRRLLEKLRRWIEAGRRRVR
jgi:hypothetical protein